MHSKNISYRGGPGQSEGRASQAKEGLVAGGGGGRCSTSMMSGRVEVAIPCDSPGCRALGAMPSPIDPLIHIAHSYLFVSVSAPAPPSLVPSSLCVIRFLIVARMVHLALCPQSNLPRCCTALCARYPPAESHNPHPVCCSPLFFLKLLLSTPMHMATAPRRNR